MNVLVCKARFEASGSAPFVLLSSDGRPVASMLTGPTTSDISKGCRGRDNRNPFMIYFLSFKKKREKLNAAVGRKNK